jgi:rhodanese-related sulfurtransferase
MTTSFWLWSGISLLVLTAVLSAAFMWKMRPARPLDHLEARELIRLGEISSIVDVRSHEEWKEGHHPQAIHIPLSDVASELPEKVKDRSLGLLFQCRTGPRAQKAAVIAQELGYTNVWYLVGPYTNLIVEPEYSPV